MRRAWAVLLAGCGFHTQAGQQVPPDGQIDATAPAIDAMIADAPAPGAMCWYLVSSSLDMHLSACPPIVAESLDITTNVSIDTTDNMTSAIPCVVMSDGPDEICALSAKVITIAAGVKLTAHGGRPLALLAHDINVLGTIDVASHVGKAPGAGSTPDGCNGARNATQFGGGGGGGFSLGGGAGGDQGNASNTGAAGGATITVSSLRGGCDGSGGGGGGVNGDPHGLGGAGGGSVWLSADTGTLTLGNAAVINASGAGGAGGSMPDRGGSGGGSGGLIVLQAKIIVRSTSTSLIFADGGGGGGGAISDAAGQAGGDPTSPNNGGSGGSGGSMAQSSHSGNGGSGAPSGSNAGVDGDQNEPGGGGGGGGGGGTTGLIWVASRSTIGTNNIVPAPIILGP